MPIIQTPTAICRTNGRNGIALRHCNGGKKVRSFGQLYLALGGSLDPEPDSQSPFDDPETWRESAAHGRPGVRVLRRGGEYWRPLRLELERLRRERQRE